MIEIISIGNEVLSGSILNTNAPFIARKLQSKGFVVSRQTVLGDEPSALKMGLQEALERSDWILTTGGLGPTFDDRTKECLAELLRVPLVFNEQVAADLQLRYPHLSSLQKQALFPKGARILPNTLGTAPGFLFHSGKATLIALPGIPQEMERMLEELVVPLLEKHISEREFFFEQNLFFTLISETELDLILQEMQKETKNLQIGIYPSLRGIRVHLLVKEKEEKTAQEKLFYCQQKLISLFPHNIFSCTSESIVETIRDLFLKKKMTLALAESCTGGAIASLLTKKPHASEYFLGSVVCYSNEMKRDFLKVREKTLREKGPVSRETILEMIDGIFHLTKADVAIAISGIAGPTGFTEELPVGSVYMGLGVRKEKSDVGLILVPKSRDMVIEYSAHFALSLLWRRVAFNLSYFEPL
jgi:nicotinamide-nucleotide amidase